MSGGGAVRRWAWACSAGGACVEYIAAKLLAMIVACCSSANRSSWLVYVHIGVGHVSVGFRRLESGTYPGC